MAHEQQIKIMCPTLTCRRILAVPGASRGKNVRCKNCGTTIKVPERASSKPEPKNKDAGNNGEPAGTKAA